MGGATNCPETPRQKMIGMMYIVLTAMLALNVSVEVINGFTLVEESLKVNIQGTENRNLGLYNKFEDLANLNPDKVGQWLTDAKRVKAESDKLYNEIEDIKLQIVKTADGKEGTLDHVEAKDNLDAASRVCLGDGGLGRGITLKKDIDAYEKLLLGYVKADKEKTTLVDKTLDTDNRKAEDGQPITWEVANFQMMPVAAALTLLTKIQADVRNLEGEVVNYLKGQVDADDFRVNDIRALVIPTSKYVIKNGKYEAQIVLAASDSTQRPEVFIGGDPKSGTGGTKVSDGKYEVSANSIGERKYAGYIRVQSPTSGVKIYPFESDYTVGEASAIISADKMNVFYAKVDNPVSISVPGVPSSSVKAILTSNGTIRQTSTGGWIVRPERAGQECVISVYAKIAGKDLKMADGKFRVKLLPPPVAYIPYADENGNPMKYKGGEKISKQYLLNLTSLRAELDDSDFDVPYNVTKFELNITNAMGSMVEMSTGAAFTEKQQTFIRQMPKGKKFFLSGIEAVGPEGPRKLKPIEVIIN
jgi:gliding motility-associated protein GldM